MACIYLIRHGQASFGEDDYDCLSKLGHQQARQLGADLERRGIHFDHAIRGGMLRHQQTADACLEAMASSRLQNIEVNLAWNEYDHQNILGQLDPAYGTAQGVKAYISQQPHPQQALEGLIGRSFDRWFDSQDNAGYVESWPAYQRRVKEALQAIRGNGSGAKHIAVFTSGGPIALLLQHLLGVRPRDLMQLNWTLINCGVSKLLSSPERVSVSSINEHSGFEGNNRHLISYK